MTPKTQMMCYNFLDKHRERNGDLGAVAGLRSTFNLSEADARKVLVNWLMRKRKC